MNHFKAVYGYQTQDIALTFGNQHCVVGIGGDGFESFAQLCLCGRIAELGQERSGAWDIGSSDAANAQGGSIS